MQGTLVVENHHEGGAEFKIVLPLDKSTFNVN
jgi:C4-dicarboxylate-specific signal transduction histidine kinase